MLARLQLQSVLARCPDPLVLIDETGYIVAESDSARAVIGSGITLVGRHAKEVFASYPEWEDSYQFEGATRYTPRVAVDEIADKLLETVFFSSAPSTQVQQLLETRQQAVAASEAQEKFFASLSHEIRTPLNAILGMTQLLTDTPLNAQQRNYLQTIHNGGETLRVLINDLLDFSKLRSGEFSLEAVPLNLADLVESAVDLVAEAAANKKLRLYVDIADDAPGELMGDPVRLRQILLNFLSNAVKFTEHGEVVVRVQRHATAQSSMIHFAVHDTGIGVPHDKISRLFRDFSQADASTTRHYGGTGLGLAICKLLAEKMGGKVGVESRPGHGSVFSFWLPTVSLPNQAPVYLAQLPSLKASTLVLFDTLEAPRDAAARVLRHTGAQVVACATLAALQRALQRAPNAIVVMADPQSAPGAFIAALTAAPASVLAFVAPAEQSKWHLMWNDAALRDVPLHVASAPPKWRNALTVLSTKPPVAAASVAPPPLKSRDLLRVLVADDNLANQRVAAAMLDKLGCTVTLVDDGAEAVAAATANKYALILLDLHMPIMDGITAARHITSIANQGLVCALTANTAASTQEACHQAGMQAFLQKPLDLSALRALLERVRSRVDEKGHGAPVSREDDFNSSTVRLTERPQRSSGTEPLPLGDPNVLSGSRLSELITDIGMETTREIVLIFIKDTNAAVKDLESLTERDAIRRLAHRLKGSAANIGAIDISKAASALETAAAADAPDASLRDFSATLRKALRRGTVALQTWHDAAV